MNILLTAIYPVGGIRTYFRYVYSHLAFSDCTFTLIGPDEGLSDFIGEYIPKDRITVIATQGKRNFISTVRKHVKKGSYDFVHSHGFSAGILTEIALFNIKKLHLMTAHDVFIKRQFEGFRGKVKQKLIGVIFNRIDLIHTVTKDANQNLLDFFPNIDQKKLQFIAHGIDSERFNQSQTRPFKQELNLPDNQLIIGFFGRFMGQKGFRVLVDAVKVIVNDNNLPNPIVLTFGWGGFIREDYQYIEQQGLSDYFVQLPNTDDMPAAIKGVDTVAMPSRWEACGLLGMEALCCGTPIVGTNCIGLREVLEDSPALSIEIDDVTALANALINSFTQEIKQATTEYVSEAVERFSVTKSAEKMHDLYTEIYQEILKEND